MSAARRPAGNARGGLRRQAVTGYGARLRRVLTCVGLVALVACTRAPVSPTPGPATGSIDSQRPLPSPLPRIAATVNGQPILIERVALAARQAQAKAQDRTQPDPGALRGALQRLIVRELLVQEALVRGVQADTRVVERAYDAERARHGSATEWHVFLSNQGLSDDDFRAELRVQVTVEALQRQVGAEVDSALFSEDEVRAFYAAHPELAQKQPPPPYEQVADRARAVLTQLRAAEHVEALVKTLEARARIDVFI